MGLCRWRESNHFLGFGVENGTLKQIRLAIFTRKSAKDFFRAIRIRDLYLDAQTIELHTLLLGFESPDSRVIGPGSLRQTRSCWLTFLHGIFQLGGSGVAVFVNSISIAPR